MASTKTTPTPACPNCGYGKGLARAVAVKGGERAVTYECERCRYRWEISMPDPPVTWTSGGPPLVES